MPRLRERPLKPSRVRRSGLKPKIGIPQPQFPAQRLREPRPRIPQPQGPLIPLKKPLVKIPGGPKRSEPRLVERPLMPIRRRKVR